MSYHNDLKGAFFSLKMSKSNGEVCFDLSLQTDIFPDPLNITKVTPVYKTGDLKEISNYRPISVLPCFSKILELITHNRLYSYLVNEKILYSKQFDFEKGPSTGHAIAQLADQIHESIENDNYTLRVFIDLFKSFDTIDHAILFKRLENYGIKGTNLASFRSYLTVRKKYIRITNDSKSDLRNTTCGVPQSSILGPLFFLVHVNDLPSSTKILNLFHKHKIS